MTVRPSIHLTADRGWVNDPYGVVWFDDEYHLFFQFVPGATRWQPSCQWGHATSPDLVQWVERAPALVPGPDETGCWSGSSVVVDGELQLFYTRVAGERLGLGQIVRARPVAGTGQWRADPDRPLVSPPLDLGVTHFRDPCVVRHDDHWVMVVGAGLEDRSAAAVHYVSDDLVEWTQTGLLCTRPSTETEGAWTGSVWECPQFFPLGDVWVLVVSVWHEDVLHRVVAATGEYDGRRFTPSRWQAITHGDSAYATSAFLDREGRRCLISWLREGPGFDPDSAVRAGAESLPYVMSLAGDGALHLSLHPDVERLLTTPSGEEDGTVRIWSDGDLSVVADADIVELCTGDGLTVVRRRARP